MMQTAGSMHRQLRERDSTKLDKENALADRLPLASKSHAAAASSGPLKAQPGPSRRPLGNITNKGAAADKGVGPAAADKKGGATATTSRRAFGDITNQANVKAAPAPSDAKPSSSLQPHGPRRAAAIAPAKAKQAAAVQHAVHAVDGDIERRAGKGWDQLEAERVQQEDSMIRQRVQALTSSLAMWPTPGLQSLSVSRRHMTEEKDDMDMSPEPVSKPASLAGPRWAAKGAAVPFSGLLGTPAPLSPSTLELLTSPSPDCESLSDLLNSSEEEDLLL